MEIKGKVAHTQMKGEKQKCQGIKMAFHFLFFSEKQCIFFMNYGKKK